MDCIKDGRLDGVNEGMTDGSVLGWLDGVEEGSSVRVELGITDGSELGKLDGTVESASDGDEEGISEGAKLELLVSVGMAEGDLEGLVVSFNEGADESDG